MDFSHETFFFSKQSKKFIKGFSQDIIGNIFEETAGQNSDGNFEGTVEKIIARIYAGAFVNIFKGTPEEFSEETL